MQKLLILFENRISSVSVYDFIKLKAYLGFKKDIVQVLTESFFWKAFVKFQ